MLLLSGFLLLSFKVRKHGTRGVRMPDCQVRSKTQHTATHYGNVSDSLKINNKLMTQNGNHKSEHQLC